MARKPWFLKEWREHRDMSQEALADRVTDLTESWGDRAMKVNKSDISKLERGKRRYNSDQLEALALVLKCDPADLVSYTPQQADEIKRLVSKIVTRGRASDLRLLRAISEDDEGSASGAA